VYWFDFGLTVLVGWAALWFTLPRNSPSLWVRLAWFALAVLAFYRCLFFIHEIVHLRRDRTRAFRWTWNALCGCLFFLPEFTYGVHLAHHATATFSTRDDPEYVPLAHQRGGELFAPFVVLLLVPMMLLVRFLVAAPLSWIVGGKFREWLLASASNLKMNPEFRWRNIGAQERRSAVLQESACLALWVALLAATIAGHAVILLLNWYIVFYAMLVLNHVRSMVAHRYVNGAGGKVSYDAQLEDSLTIGGFSPAAALLAPIGLRYHALHHLFPTMPYHALGEAHRRLSKALPPDHAYVRTIVPGVWPAFREFAVTRRATRDAQNAGREARATMKPS
jgi:fatty acid desaturase